MSRDKLLYYLHLRIVTYVTFSTTYVWDDCVYVQNCYNEDKADLKPEDILYMEVVERTTFCYTAERVYELEEKLYELEEKCAHFDFMRVSKSYIMNLQRIRALKPDFGGKILATMENGEKLYISRQYTPVLKEKLGLGGRRA